MDFILFSVGLVLLIKGADKFIQYAKIVAKSVGVSEFIIGLVLASIATTLPELTVSIIASLQGNSNLALGNAVGSVLANISLILGFSSLLRPMKVDEIAWKNSLFLFVITLLLWFLMRDYVISRLEGLILILIYIEFLYLLYRRNSKKEDEEVKKEKFPVKEVIFIFISSIVIVIGSRLLVISSVNMARALGVSEAVIGLTLVSLGTSLPEFANSMTSIIKKLPNIGAGNILGANIINVLMVVGIASLINPIRVEQNLNQIIIPLALFVILTLTISLKRDNIIGRRTSVILLSLYLLFLIISFLT